MIKHVVFFLLVLASGLSHAKDIKLFKNFPPDNPMSYQFVRTIDQDKNGFIWIGTQEGLHRFDGYKLISFHHDSENAASLSSNVVSRILIDDQRRFWVGTHGKGLNLYQEDSNNFLHFTTKSDHAALSNDNVNALLEDSNGNLWIGTDKGLNILSGEPGNWSVTQVLQELANPNSLSHNVVHAIVETAQGEIWVGTNGGGITVFDLTGRFIKTIKYGDDSSSSYVNKFINSLLADEQGHIWIGTVDSGILKYDTRSDSFTHYQYEVSSPSSIVSNTIQSIYQDSKGKVWIATDKGLLIYNEESNDFSRFNHTPGNPYSVSNDFVLTFFEDNNNMMWIGTFTGVNRWDPNMTSFSQFSSHTNPELTNSNITSFTQVNDSEVLFSTYSGGIYRLSYTDNTLQKLDLDEHFADLRIMTLHYANGSLWVGTRSAGAFKVDLTSQAITNYKHEADVPTSLSANSVTDIIQDKSGQVWVSTFHQGLNRLNRDGSFTRFVKNEQSPQLGPSSNHILQMLVDEQGIFWLATYGGGLNRFDPNQQSFTHIKHSAQEPTSLSSDLAWFMLLDDSQQLWVGTQAAGLNVLSKENRRRQKYSFEHLTTKDGMKSLTVYGITQDIQGDIWFSSNKGISRFKSTDRSFKHFDLSHGIVDLEYNHGSIFKDNRNTLYFGSGKGFTSVNPDATEQSVAAPVVRLTNILKLNEPMSFDVALSALERLELDYSDQIVSFEYVGLNYSNPASTRYKYRLLGFDQEWIDAGNSQRATYTNLPAGAYQLQVIAGNNDNVWSEPSISLNILVRPAPWNTWWAYLLYALTIALALLTYARLLNRKLLQEQEQKESLKQQVEDKTQKYLQQNAKLEQANKQLENAATTDKVTGVKSRRYLDIYIEQATQLMTQIHENILPVQRHILPRLYLVMVRLNNVNQISNSQLVDLTDLLLYSRNKDDLVIRWSEDTFAIIGFEKDDNVRELASRLSPRFSQVLKNNTKVNMAYSFYPFNFEQPMELSWDQVSVLTEHGLKLVQQDDQLSWLGMYAPKAQPFDYLQVLQLSDRSELGKIIKSKQG